jgi:hypothetical protein
MALGDARSGIRYLEAVAIIDSAKSAGGALGLKIKEAK